MEQRLAVGGLTIVQAGQVHPSTIGFGSWIWLSSISWETVDFGWFDFLVNKIEKERITVSQRILVVSRDERENRKRNTVCL